MYASYLQSVALIIPAVLLVAWSARPRRGAISGGQRWRYALLTLGVVTVAVILIWADPNAAAIDIPFLALVLPGTLLGTLGSSVLGIALRRSHHRPRGSAFRSGCWPARSWATTA